MILRNHRQKGVSLLEILVVTLLLTTVLLAFAMVFPSGYRLIRSTRLQSQASEIANGYVNIIRDMSFDDPNAKISVKEMVKWPATSNTAFFSDSGNLPQPFYLLNAASGSDPKSIDVKILDSTFSSGGTLARITVTVYWNDTLSGSGKLKRRSVTVTSYKSKNH